MTRILTGHAKVLLVIALLGSLLAGWTSFQRLRYSSDRTDMLAADQPVQTAWRAFHAEFGQTMDYVVLARGSSPETREAIEAVAARLKGQPDHFEQILYRLDLPGLATASLFYLSLDDLRGLSRELQTARPWLTSLSHPKGAVAGLKAFLARSDKAQLARRITPALPLLTQLLEALVVSLESRGEAPYQSPFDRFEPEVAVLSGSDFVPGQTRFYTTLDGGQTHMLLVRARLQKGSYRSDVDSLERLRALVGEVRARHPEVRFFVSGEPVINTDEMVGAVGDAVRSGTLSLALVSFLLVLAFGNWQRAGAVLLSLLMALTWSCAFAGLTVGSLNLLTVNFATILVGLGMTFGIHMVYGFEYKRRAGQTLTLALRETLAHSGRDNLIGALTTAVAFWALYFTSFRAAGELGLIAGAGVLFCFLSTVTVLPCLLAITDGGPHVPLPSLAWMAQVERYFRARSGRVVLVSFVLSLYSASWLNRIDFDYNVLNMQPGGSEAVQVEHYLQSAGYSALFAVSISQGPGEARLQTARFARLASVARVESVAMFEPLGVLAKQPVVVKIIESVRGLRPPGGMSTRLTALELLALYQNSQEIERAFRRLIPNFAARADRQRLSLLLERLDASLSLNSPGPAEGGVRSFANHLSRDLDARLRFLQTQRATPPAGLGQLPKELLSRSRSERGRLVVRIFPRHDCWEREALEQFVRQLRQIDPQVTGTPILILQYLQELRLAFSVSARNALLVIVILLLLHFRSWRRAALAVCPKLLGLLWMIGLMGVLGVPFNPANSMALPLTLGIGLVFGVQVLQHYLEPKSRSLFEDSTGPAILVSSLASVLGFVTLLLAQHRGVASFGLVMTLGVISTLAASTLTLPAVVTLLKARGYRI